MITREVFDKVGTLPKGEVILDFLRSNSQHAYTVSEIAESTIYGTPLLSSLQVEKVAHRLSHLEEEELVLHKVHYGVCYYTVPNVGAVTERLSNGVRIAGKGG